MQSDQASWFTLRNAGIAAGVVIVFGGAVYIFASWRVKKPVPKRGILKNQTQAEPHHSFKQFREDLKDSDKRNATLDNIYESTRYHETHDHFRTSGCLDVLLRLFSEHSNDEGVVFRLIRVLANLATNKENRLIIGESHAIEDMIYYLDSRWNADIREDVLRGLMNLAIAVENEELIREKGALDVLLQLYKTEQPDSKILLHTSRVLVNLACNATNRKVMVRQKTVERTIELLHVSDDIDLLPRIIRLYGTFALECSDSTYQILAETKNALRLATLLKKQLELKDAKITSLCEIIIYAIARIVTVAEKRPTIADEVHAFANVFGEVDEKLGCAPASLIASLVSPDGSFSAVSSTQNESLYMAVVTSLKFISAISERTREALRNDSEAFSRIKVLQSHINPQLAKVAKELFDLVLPPVTAVDELD